MSATRRGVTQAGSTASIPRFATRSTSTPATSPIRRPSPARSHGCDTVLHLGALIPIPYSYRHPREFVAANVVGTLNVLEAARTGRRASRRPGLVERGVRDCAEHSDAGGTSAPSSVAVRGHEGRRRPARAQLRPVVRAAGRGRAALQYVRPAAVGARGDPDDRHAGADPRPDRARRDRDDSRLSLRDRYRRRVGALRRGRRSRRRGVEPRHRT